MRQIDEIAMAAIRCFELTDKKLTDIFNGLHESMKESGAGEISATMSYDKDGHAEVGSLLPEITFTLREKE